jgi:hypothetical protein
MKGDHINLQVLLGNGKRESIKYGADIEEVLNKSILLTGFSSK